MSINENGESNGTVGQSVTGPQEIVYFRGEDTIIMDADWINEVARHISEASSSGAVQESRELTGFSGQKLIGTLQRLAAFNTTDQNCYLEIGVFQGLTLLSVASVLGDRLAFGIDNFTQLDINNENLSLVEDRMRRLQLHNATIINMDFEDALAELMSQTRNQKIAVYFVDGPHDYRSQLMCLELAKPHLAENAIILIDDSNYQHVRQANRDFLLVNPGFKLFFQAYTKSHPANMNADDLKEARAGWWNGINIIVRDEKNELASEFPPTARDRTFFMNEHIVHASQFAVCSDRAVRFASAIYRFNLIKAVGHYWKLVTDIRKRPLALRGKFEFTNTYSEGLPSSSYNSAISQ